MTPLEQKLADKILNDALKTDDPQAIGRYVDSYSLLLYAVRQNESQGGSIRKEHWDKLLGLPTTSITETTPAEVPELVTTEAPAPAKKRAKKRAKKQAKQADPAPEAPAASDPVEPESEAPAAPAAEEAPADETPGEPEEAQLVQPKEDILTHAAVVERIKEYRRINTPYLVAKGIDHKKLLREVLERFGLDSIPACPMSRLEEFSAAIDEICQPVN